MAISTVKPSATSRSAAVGARKPPSSSSTSADRARTGGTPTLVGTVTQRGTLGSIFFWNNRDVELIGGQSYAARVYTGGVVSSTSKAVVGAGDPVAGFTGYCTSGQTSGEQCNQTVQSTGAIACTQTGCKWPIISYTGGPVAARRLGRLDVPPGRRRPGVRARLGDRGQRHHELRRASGAACRPRWACPSPSDPRRDRRLINGAEGQGPFRAASAFVARSWTAWHR